MQGDTRQEDERGMERHFRQNGPQARRLPMQDTIVNVLAKYFGEGSRERIAISKVLDPGGEVSEYQL